MAHGRPQSAPHCSWQPTHLGCGNTSCVLCGWLFFQLLLHSSSQNGNPAGRQWQQLQGIAHPLGTDCHAEWSKDTLNFKHRPIVPP